MAATGPAKLRAVTQLMNKLAGELDKPSLSQSDLDSSLEELKIYGRDPTNSDPIFTPDGIKILARHAFESSSRSTARGALRVLANAMLLRPETRQLLADLPYEAAACAQLRTEGPKSWDDSFLLSRVLLMFTYAPNHKLPEMLKEHGLAEAIIANIAKHTEVMGQPAHNPRANPMEEMALNETLRLLFNVTHISKTQKSLFTPAVPLIIGLLWKHDIPSKPLDPPFSSVINALLNLDLEDKSVQSSLCPESGEGEPTRVAARLIQLLDLALKDGVYPVSKLDETLAPLAGVLVSVYNNATGEVQQFYRTKLLPTEDERERALGRGGSLPARLLRITNDPISTQVGEVVSELLFNLSDRDPARFTENVGFGYASGFLARNNLSVPANVASTANSSTTRAVNPITGQFLDSEQFPDMPEMTEDEKLREAERLFVLFERLKNTGIVDVRNPVEEAMRSGAFQDGNENRVTELDSDDDDDKKKP